MNLARNLIAGLHSEGGRHGGIAASDGVSLERACDRSLDVRVSASEEMKGKGTDANLKSLHTHG